MKITYHVPQSNWFALAKNVQKAMDFIPVKSEAVMLFLYSLLTNMDKQAHMYTKYFRHMCIQRWLLSGCTLEVLYSTSIASWVHQPYK